MVPEKVDIAFFKGLGEDGLGFGVVEVVVAQDGIGAVAAAESVQLGDKLVNRVGAVTDEVAGEDDQIGAFLVAAEDGFLELAIAELNAVVVEVGELEDF